jgi:crotonobetainyl-CoA:carnitine CoA-transferase CaiB-like acyl-CoA transferase
VTELARRLTRLAWQATGAESPIPEEMSFIGSGALPAVFPVTDFACSMIACAGLAVMDLVREIGGSATPIIIDRRKSSLWFRASIRPIGWTLPSPWDPIAGDYHTQDGWIRLHTNAPKHKQAALKALQTTAEKDQVSRAVSQRKGRDLEEAVIGHGGCAAEMRSLDEWHQHSQGLAVASEPLVHLANARSTPSPKWPLRIARPLQGVRVLDLTRVLAGPVATRFLAGYGAEVLRIDPLDWDEPGVIPEVTLGKRCARLDLANAAGRAAFEVLLSQAHIIVHGYRPGALDTLGYDAARRRALSPGLIDISLDAYGWHGPWCERRGFDSLVQMSTGIADSGMREMRANKPVPLPVQALDHGTGYLMAAAAIRGMTKRLRQGSGTQARLSLARTAKFLIDHKIKSDEPALEGDLESDWSKKRERTEWGFANRASSPLQIVGTPIHWDLPACSLGSAPAGWTAD